MPGFFIIIAAMSSIAEQGHASPALPDKGNSLFSKDSMLLDSVYTSSFQAFGELDDLGDIDLLNVDAGKAVNSEDCVGQTPVEMRSSATGDVDQLEQVADGRSCAILFLKFLVLLALVAAFDHLQFWLRDESVEGKRASTVQTDLALRAEDSWGCTSLHCAAASGASVEGLLESGADVNAREAWDETPLHFAARAGHLEACKLLIAKGSDINAANTDGHTALVIAAEHKMSAVCELMLDHGGHANGVSDEDLPPMLSALLTIRMFANMLPST